MEIHIDGLELYAYHGVLPEEKALGQPFLLDLRLMLSRCPGSRSDRVEDTIDYTEVIDVVSGVVTEECFNLLERLADAVARAVLERFPVDRVRVRVSKPRPPIPCSLRGVGVSLEMGREEAAG
jgi:dihydroneopterin aldolase